MMRKNFMMFPWIYAIVGESAQGWRPGLRLLHSAGANRLVSRNAQSVSSMTVLLGLAWVTTLMVGCSPDTPPSAPSSMPPGALGPLRTVEFELAGIPVTIEVAITGREQQQGLMYRESMPENHGMLFVYTEPRYMSFWMQNTRIPLSIAFIREDGVISNIEDMKPQSGPFPPVERYGSTQRSLYALEMNQSWFERHGIAAGDRISLPTEEIQRLMQ